MHRGGGAVCIGALSDPGAHLRLMTNTCGYHSADCPYQVGQAWEVAVRPCPDLRPPHLEDVAIVKARLLGEEEDLRGFILDRVTPWRGSIQVIFDDLIEFTGNGSGYISESTGVPKSSTGFWFPDRDLTFQAQPRQAYYAHDGFRHLSYVGTAPAIPIIKAGILVRVSLAKWWRQREADPSFEYRCYAQFSGWY
jgi:hypothetical protein